MKARRRSPGGDPIEMLAAERYANRKCVYYYGGGYDVESSDEHRGWRMGIYSDFATPENDAQWVGWLTAQMVDEDF